MTTTERPIDYVFAVAFAVLALGVRWSLQPWLGALQPFAPGFVAIAAAVLTLGWRPAVITAIVSYLGGTFLFVQPGGPVMWTRPQDIAAVITFGMSSGLIIMMGHRARDAERRLARANDQLRAADHRKDQFLATLSHELRNPVGVIAAAVSILESTDTDPGRRSTIAILGRQVAQMRRLVDDLLDIGRIARGRLALNPVPVDLRTCVEQARDGSLHVVLQKQQSLQTRVPDASVELYADHARIVQVLTNLIDNASKYSPERAEIEVTLTDGSEVILDVTDTGPGISEDILPHVFEMFDQGASSASGGLGLGLGLCKRIVELHGGTIEAAANPRGRGSRFIVRLPKVVGDRRVPDPAVMVSRLA